MSATPHLRLLVVEDDDAARQALGVLLSDLGYDVDLAVDGVGALNAHEEQPFDLILSDWVMPNRDGMELCRRVRASDGTQRFTYFMLMTAHSDRRHLVEGLRGGADDFIGKPIALDELEARLIAAERVIRLHRRLFAKNRSLRKDSQRFFRQARLDPLTQTANRLELDEDLPRLAHRFSDLPGSACVAVCDIDNFKLYNDGFGHLAGDEVLRRVAESIRRSLRHSDSLYRYGGEEFVVMLPEQTLDQARVAMERVRRAVEALEIPNPAVPGGRLTISVGIATVANGDGDAPSRWLERADRALYQAKDLGRNRTEIWQADAELQSAE